MEQLQYRKFSLAELVKTQSERMGEVLWALVPAWKMAVPLKPITAGDLVDATTAATYIDIDRGQPIINEHRKNAFLCSRSIIGFPDKDFQFLEREKAGTLLRLVEKVYEISGFKMEINLVDHFEEEKKN